MGAFLAYTVYSGIFLLAGYLLYKLAMAGEKQMALNRAVLLGIYVLAFAAWPLSCIQWLPAAPTADAAFDLSLIPGRTVDDGTAQALWPVAIIAIYLTGLTASAVFTVITALRLVKIVRSGVRFQYDGYTLVVLSEGTVAPFSWGRYVVMSKGDYDAAGDTVTAHELAHIHCRHCLDLIVAQAVCIVLWYNPAAWLMREELKTVHEYQADASVLASGINPRTYQMLLIKKAVGTRFQSLANSLNHSKLKKRITMMYKEKNSGLRRLRGLVLALAPVAAIAVVNIPAVAGCLGSIRAASIETADEPIKVTAVGTMRKDTQKISETEPEQRAQFPGGEAEMFRYMSFKIKYPKSAVDADHQGRSVVQFTVNADGSLSDFKIVKSSYPELDAEAIRVVASMPAWIPAKTGGKAVASVYSVPVTFSLNGDEKAKPKKTDKSTSGINFEGPDAPAVTVDGVRVASLDKIAAEDIESIKVFKDKAEYPNGLIQITLKH